MSALNVTQPTTGSTIGTTYTVRGTYPVDNEVVYVYLSDKNGSNFVMNGEWEVLLEDMATGNYTLTAYVDQTDPTQVANITVS